MMLPDDPEMIVHRTASGNFLVALPRAPENLDHLTDMWHVWPLYDNRALVRRLDGGRFVAIEHMLHTWALLVGRLDEAQIGYSDSWCYASLLKALIAASAWNGEGEPTGWHRHPFTGRRRPDGDPDREHVSP